MPKKVLLVGHCGSDGSYLRLAVKKAYPDVALLAADDPEALNDALAKGVDLVLVNRELGYDLGEKMGVDLIRELKQGNPQLKLMLVSNYPDAQVEAAGAGALEGFGKREIGSARVTRLLQDALGQSK